MATTDNAAVIRDIHDAFNRKDVKRLAELGGQCTVSNPSFGATLALKDYEQAWATAFPDGKIEPIRTIVQGDVVVVEFIGRGTHTGPLNTPSANLEPTGRKVDMRFVEIFEFKNGKPVTGIVYFDSAQMMRQLGVIKELPFQREEAERPEVRPH